MLIAKKYHVLLTSSSRSECQVVELEKTVWCNTIHGWAERAWNTCPTSRRYPVSKYKESFRQKEAL